MLKGVKEYKVITIIDYNFIMTMFNPFIFVIILSIIFPTCHLSFIIILDNLVTYYNNKNLLY
jgi:hypothetical protein